MYETLGANYLKGKVPLAIELGLKTFLNAAGYNVIQHLSLTDIFINHIANITTILVLIFAGRRQMNQQRHHFEPTLKVFLVSEQLSGMEIDNQSGQHAQT